MSGTHFRYLISPSELSEALHALGIDPIAAIRDPVRCMRLVASADTEDLGRFLSIVLDVRPAGLDDEALRLYAAAILAVLLRKMRGQRFDAKRERRSAVVP